jgi:alkanesulfonate monooxygenase SsuD/methylene tetrahydromethanopterin reductase-like flavin-dependent oxidoreductase (luciferase family)
MFVDYARTAERLGFDELWIIEDCFLNGGIAQAAIALSSTSSIRVGLGILPAAARNVAFAAMEIGTLCRMFPGRLTVGIGHGQPDWIRQVGAWPRSPLTLLSEYMTSLRRLLSGENVTLAGDYVSLSEVLLAQPLASPPRLLAGVRGPRSVSLAGTVADGLLLAEPVTPEYLRSVTAQLGATSPSFEIAAYNVAAVDLDPELARIRARAGLAWIGDPEWAPHIDPLPFAAEFKALRSSSNNREDFAKRLPAEWVDQLAIVGTPEMARSRIDALAHEGASRVILTPAGQPAMDAIDGLALVLPR